MAIRPISPHERPSYFMPGISEYGNDIFYFEGTDNEKPKLIGFKNNSHIAYTAGFNF